MTTANLVAPDLTTRLESFLALLRDPAAGEALYDAYAPDAPLYFRGAVLRRDAIDRAEFGWVVAAGARQAAGAPRPDLGPPRVLRAQDLGDRALVWFAAREAAAGHEVTGAVGFTRVGDAWKVHWATLAPEGTEWSWRQGLAQSVADAPFADAAQLLAPRSWLDVAYYRDHLKPRPKLLALPEARFRCQSSLGCCDIGFRIELPPTSQAIIDAIPWDEVRPALAGTKLEPVSDTKVLLKDAGEACRFLDEDRHCVVHKTLGRAAFPVCTTYPVHFMPTPEGVVVTTAMTCPSARAALGPQLLEREEDLYLRLAMNPQAPTREAFALAPGHEVDYATYQEAEAALLAILLRTELPLLDRLHAGERELHRRIGAAALPERRPVAGAAERGARRRFVAAIARNIDATLVPADGDLVSRAAEPMAAELVSTLRSLLFMKYYGFTCDLLTAWHVGVFGSLLTLHVGSCFPDGRVPQKIQWEINSLLFHGKIFDTLTADDAQAAALREDFGRPGFGVELLSIALAEGDAGEADAAEDGWRPLETKDLDGVFDFLAAEPLVNMPYLDALSVARAHGFDLGRLGWFGRWDSGRWRAITTTTSCLWPYAAETAYQDELGVILRGLIDDTPWMLVAEPAGSRILGPLLEKRPPIADRLHQVMTLDRADLVCGAPDPAVRRATLDELAVVVANEAGMLREECLHDPLEDNLEGFTATIARRIAAGRVFVLEEEGEIRYQFALGCVVPELRLGELINAYTPPAFRRRGYARRALPHVCRLAFEEVDRLLVTPRVDHQTIIAMDEAVGFKTTPLRLREVMWEDPAGSAGPM